MNHGRARHLFTSRPVRALLAVTWTGTLLMGCGDPQWQLTVTNELGRDAAFIRFYSFEMEEYGQT